MTETRLTKNGINSELAAYIYEYNNKVRVTYVSEYTTKSGSVCERTYDVYKSSKKEAEKFLTKKFFK